MKDHKAAQDKFKEWVEKKVEDAKHMNINSGLQIRALLFPDMKENNGTRVFKIRNPEYDQW